MLSSRNNDDLSCEAELRTDHRVAYQCAQRIGLTSKIQPVSNDVFFIILRRLHLVQPAVRRYNGLPRQNRKQRQTLPFAAQKNKHVSMCPSSMAASMVWIRNGSSSFPTLLPYCPPLPNSKVLWCGRSLLIDTHPLTPPGDATELENLQPPCLVIKRNRRVP